MNLSVQDARLFYEVQMPLLAYVSAQLEVWPDVAIGRDLARHSAADVAKIRDAFLEHPDLLDRFIEENPERLPADRLAIVAAWKHRVAGDFLAVRFLKAYTVFMSTDSPAHLYGVLGLFDPLKDVFGGAPPPLFVRTILLPFQGKIVHDGLISVRSIHFGPGLRSSFSQQYNQLKEREGIIEQLVDAEGQPHVVTSLAHQKPRKPAPDWRPIVDDIAAKTEKMRQADSQLQGAALELLRASARLAQEAFADPASDLGAAMRQVRTAITKLQRQVGR